MNGASQQIGWRAFAQGAGQSLPVIIAAGPIGLLFGALSVTRGLTPLDALAMSATVFAGASQMVAIELFERAVPAWAILLSVFAVNFRHVLYSAAITPLVRPLPTVRKAIVFALLIDPQFALTVRREERGLPFSMAWYLGLGLTTYAMWLIFTFVGATFGRLLTDPEALALDMLFPIYFLGLVMGFRDRPNWAPIVLASAVVSAVVYYGPALGMPWLGAPWHVTLGGLAGILVAVLRAPAPPRASDDAAGARDGAPA